MQASQGIKILLACWAAVLAAQDSKSSLAQGRSEAARLHNQGILAQGCGRFAEAEAAFRQALRAWNQLPPASPAEIAATLNGLGNLRRVEGRYPEAERLLRRAILYEERAGSKDSLDLAFSLNSLGALYCNDRQPRRGAPLIDKGLKIREHILGPYHPLVASSLDNLAEVQTQERKPDRAVALYHQSLRILESAGDASLLAMTRCKLADLYARRLGDPRQAEGQYLKALEAWKGAAERDHPQYGLTLTGLAELYLVEQRYAEAEPS